MCKQSRLPAIATQYLGHNAFTARTSKERPIYGLGSSNVLAWFFDEPIHELVENILHNKAFGIATIFKSAVANRITPKTNLILFSF